jgi:hypothetical protein
MGVAKPSDRSDTSPPLGSSPRDPEMDGRANGSPWLTQPQLAGGTAGATAGSAHTMTLEDVGGARLLVSDVRVALLLLDEARYRVVNRLFGVERDQSWLVTLIALAVLAQAAQEKSDQMLKGPGGPTRTDMAFGAVGLRELLTWISGPPSRDTPLVGSVVTIAVLGALARPGLTRAAHRIMTSSHHAKASFNHRYGHLLPVPGAGNQRAEAKTR